MRRIELKRAQAASSSTVRSINRQIVLNYIRDREPISRAEIAREAALQRSTVSNIVEELKKEGLIEELGAGESTGGRRPTLLRLRASCSMAIGVDISPSRTVIAVSDLAGQVRMQEGFPTSARLEETSAQIIKRVREWVARDSKRKIEGIGISLPGLVDPYAGKAIYIPHFKWRDWDVAAELSAATGLEVAIDNDANEAALAELWFGREEVSNARDFIMVLVAEGVGTGIVFDGQIYRGERGAAGEFGHMIVGTNGPIACSCGNHDCWEAFASGRAAVARYLEKSRRRSSPRTVDFARVVDLALAGDDAATDALTETAHYLGIGISNLIVGLSPEAVVVGGVIARAWPLVEEAVSETMERSVRRGLPSARIAASTIGDQPTLMGAISLVLSRKFAFASTAYETPRSHLRPEAVS